MAGGLDGVTEDEDGGDGANDGQHSGFYGGAAGREVQTGIGAVVSFCCAVISLCGLYLGCEVIQV